MDVPVINLILMHFLACGVSEFYLFGGEKITQISHVVSFFSKKYGIKVEIIDGGACELVQALDKLPDDDLLFYSGLTISNLDLGKFITNHNKSVYDVSLLINNKLSYSVGIAEVDEAGLVSGLKEKMVDKTKNSYLNSFIINAGWKSSFLSFLKSTSIDERKISGSDEVIELRIIDLPSLFLNYFSGLLRANKVGAYLVESISSEPADWITLDAIENWVKLKKIFF